MLKNIKKTSIIFNNLRSNKIKIKILDLPYYRTERYNIGYQLNEHLIINKNIKKEITN